MSIVSLVPSSDALAIAQALSRANHHGVFLGESSGGLVFAPPQHGVLVLGPPRSGKTTSIVLPNLFAANGSVLAISTKTDLIDSTLQARSRLGPVLLFDPGVGIERSDIEHVGWSPLRYASSWDQAVLTAEAMVGATRQSSTGDQGHWSERAGALLAPLFHAGALMQLSMADVVSAVNRRDAAEFIAALARARSLLAMDLLVGITETDSREQSGIWSTASGVLAAYRSAAALEDHPHALRRRRVRRRTPDALHLCHRGHPSPRRPSDRRTHPRPA